MTDQIQQIIDKYKNDMFREFKEDLKILMKHEGIKGLAYRTYTPSFNDGDPCLPCLEFVVPLNSYIEDMDAYVFAHNGHLDYILNGDVDCDYTDSIPKEHLELLKDPNFDLSNLEYKYKTEYMEFCIYRIAELILPTNEEGYILDTGERHYQTYYCDY